MIDSLLSSMIGTLTLDIDGFYIFEYINKRYAGCIVVKDK